MSKDAMGYLSAGFRFQVANAEAEAAYQQYSYAGRKLELARIHQRLAEIDSQHEPLASLMASGMDEREKLVAIARYVVTGRKHDAAIAKAEGATEGAGEAK